MKGIGTRGVTIALAATVIACGGGGVTPTVTPTEAPQSRSTPTPTEAPIPTVAPSPAPTATPAPSPTAPPDWTALPVVALDPDGIVRQLTMVEQAIRDPNVSGAQLVWMGHLEQLAISQINDSPQWTDQVLAAMPDGPRKSIAASLQAGRQLRQMHGRTPTTLPDWKIVEPAPAADLLKFYKEAEQKYGVPWYYLASINLVESRMGRIRGDSSAGAQGPMQFIPQTWASYGEGDVNAPHDAIMAAARYLKAAGAPGDMSKALYAYNHSQLYVNGVTGYAEVMHADPDAFRGYYGWQVYYTTVDDGTLWLKVGWHK